MASRHSSSDLPPIESTANDVGIDSNGWAGLKESASTAALITEETRDYIDIGDKPMLDDSDIEPRLPIGHSSRASLEILNNNKQEPIQIDEDIMPAITFVPQMSQHYIGYHPQKLYKVKEKLHTSEGVSFLPDDRLVVADKHDGHVMIFDENGHFERMLLKGVKPCGIATNRSGMVAFTDVKHKKESLVKVYTEDGTKVSEFGSKLNWKPRGITVSNKGLLVVTDVEAKTNCVGIYTIDGKMMSTFGRKGNGKDELGEPLYVHVDIKDRILVSDKSHHCIKAYDERGSFLGKIGHHGSGNGCLLNPRGITEDAYGHILVCDTGNRRVSAFTHEGHFIKHLLEASDGVQYPVDIAFSRQSGKLAVTMHKPNGDFHKLRVYQLPNIESEAIQKVYR